MKRARGTLVASHEGMRGARVSTAVTTALLILGIAPAAASQDGVSPARLNLNLDISYFMEVRPPRFTLAKQWADSRAVTLPRYPFMADPRRWPRLFANTTECTLSLNPITRRHWWQG